MPMRLREKKAPRGQYRESNVSPPPETAKFAHPTVLYNPNLPQAAFPTLDFIDPPNRISDRQVTDTSRINEAGLENNTPAAKKAVVFRSNRPPPAERRASLKIRDDREPGMEFDNWTDLPLSPTNPGDFYQAEDWWDDPVRVQLPVYANQMEFASLPDNMKFILFNEIQLLGQDYQDNAEALLEMTREDRDHVIDLCLRKQKRCDNEENFKRIARSQRVVQLGGGDDEEPGTYANSLLEGLEVSEPLDGSVSHEDMRQAEKFLRHIGLLNELRGPIREYYGVAYEEEHKSTVTPPESQEALVEQLASCAAPLTARKDSRSRRPTNVLLDASSLPIPEPQDDSSRDPDFGKNRRRVLQPHDKVSKRQKLTVKDGETSTSKPLRKGARVKYVKPPRSRKSNRASDIRDQPSSDMHSTSIPNTKPPTDLHGQKSSLQTPSSGFGNDQPTVSSPHLKFNVSSMEVLPPRAPNPCTTLHGDVPDGFSEPELKSKQGSSPSSAIVVVPRGKSFVPQLLPETEIETGVILSTQQEQQTESLTRTRARPAQKTPRGKAPARRRKAQNNVSVRKTSPEMLSSQLQTELGSGITKTNYTSENPPILPPGYTSSKPSQVELRTMAPPSVPRPRSSLPSNKKSQLSPATQAEQNGEQLKVRGSPTKKRQSRKSAESMDVDL